MGDGSSPSPGTLYGIGCGPGDPELLTLKAVRLMRACPVLAYPCNREGRSRALEIVADHLPEGQERLPVPMVFDPKRTPDHAAYDKAAAVLAPELEWGRDVAMLCEGDPFLFGSFIYLFARLAERFPVEVVPGVSSIMACAARLRHPIVTGNDRLAVIPAPLPEDDLERALAACEGAAIMKLGRHLEKVVRVLDRLDLLEHARYIEQAGTPDERIASPRDLPSGPAPYFAMILVHKRKDAWAPCPRQ